MVNKLTKQQVVEGLVQIRDDLIEVNRNLEFKSVQDRWHDPDCLEWAINFIEKHDSGDTIRLPYKEKIDSSLWRVLFRTKEVEGVLMSLFSDEAKADKFIAELKENK